MVSVQHKTASTCDTTDWRIQPWLDSLSRKFSAAEIELIRQACELAEPLYTGQTEITGAPLFQHALGAAAILAGMNMDSETIAAAILHAMPEYQEECVNGD